MLSSSFIRNICEEACGKEGHRGGATDAREVTTEEARMSAAEALKAIMVLVTTN
jgi:hypothetical protein